MNKYLKRQSQRQLSVRELNAFLLNFCFDEEINHFFVIQYSLLVYSPHMLVVVCIYPYLTPLFACLFYAFLSSISISCFPYI